MTQHVVCKNKDLEDVTCIFSTCRFCRLTETLRSRVTFERSLVGLLITVVRWFWTQRSMDDAVLSSHLVLVVLVDGADSDGGPHRTGTGVLKPGNISRVLVSLRLCCCLL